jgi:hypothetical protein
MTVEKAGRYRPNLDHKSRGRQCRHEVSPSAGHDGRDALRTRGIAMAEKRGLHSFLGAKIG